MKGIDTSKGSINYMGKPISENSLPIKVLKKAGAIPFVKTNVA